MTIATQPRRTRKVPAFPQARPYRAVRRVKAGKLNPGDWFIRHDKHTGQTLVGVVVHCGDPESGWVFSGYSLGCLWRAKSNQTPYNSAGPSYFRDRGDDEWYLAERDPSYPPPEDFDNCMLSSASDAVELSLWSLATTGEVPDRVERRYALHALASYWKTAERTAEMEESCTMALDALIALVRGLDSGDQHAISDARDYLGTQGVCV